MGTTRGGLRLLARGAAGPVARGAAGLALVGAAVILWGSAALAASVRMVDDDFNPASIRVSAGDTITFTNAGDRPHTATADGGAFDTGAVDPGGSASVRIGEPGTYRFYCRFHGGPGGEGMSGTITVTAAGTGGTGGTGGNRGTAGTGGAGPTGGTARGASPTLPQTATPLPVIGGVGAITLLSGLWLGRRRGPR